MHSSTASLLVVKIYLLTACTFLLCGSITSSFLAIPLIHGTFLFFFVLIPGFLNAFSIYISLRYFPITVCIWRNTLSLLLFFLGAICWIGSLFFKSYFLLLWTSSISLVLLSIWVLSWHFIVYLYHYKSLRKIQSFLVYAFVCIHAFLLFVIPAVFITMFLLPMDMEGIFWSMLHPISYAFMVLIIGVIADRIFVFKNHFIYRIHHIAIILLMLMAFGFYLTYSMQHKNPFGGEAYIMLTMTSAIPIFFLLLYWIVGLWKNNMTMNLSTCFALMCMSLFIFGGLMDIFFIKYHLPIRLGDTYFTVAHFHLIIGVCISMAWLSCIYHNWNKIFTKFNLLLLDNGFYKFHFWVTFTGIYIIFTLMYYVGLIGIPKLYFASNNQSANSSISVYQYITFCVSGMVWFMQIAFVIRLLWQTIKSYSQKEN